jgi:hypothetical protein
MAISCGFCAPRGADRCSGHCSGTISRIVRSQVICQKSYEISLAIPADWRKAKADVHTELKSNAITSMPSVRQRRNRHAGVLAGDERERSGQHHNSTRTDGATKMNIWLPNQTCTFPAERIDNVSTSSFDAEQGMARGAAVTVVAKSGTNQFKGTAFESDNGDKLNTTRITSSRRPDQAVGQIQNLRRGRWAAPSQRGRLCADHSKATNGRRVCSRSLRCRTRRSALATSAKRRSAPRTTRNSDYDPFTRNADLNMFALPNAGASTRGLTNNYDIHTRPFGLEQRRLFHKTP